MHIKVASKDDASNLSNLLKDGDWMVLYYADWCGHCNTMKPEWSKVVNKLSNSNKMNKVNVAEIESTHIGDLINKPKIEGFPSIKMYNSGKEIASFNDQRVADKIEAFANSNSSKRSNNMKMFLSNTKPKPNVRLVKSRGIKTRTPKSRTPKSRIAKTKTPKVKIPKSKYKTVIKIRVAKSRAKSNTNTKSKRLKGKTVRTKTQIIRTTTKNVFDQLIKSFGRIGKEAKQDAVLLKSASNKLS